MKTFNQTKPSHQFTVGDVVCKRTHKGVFLAMITKVDTHTLEVEIQVLRDDVIPERVGQSWSQEIPTLKSVMSPTSELLETQETK